MKRFYFGLILFSLIGLGVVQYRFFILSLQLANARYSIQLNETLGLVGKYLYLETPLTTLVSSSFKGKIADYEPNKRYDNAAAIQLEQFLRKRFEKVGVKVDFAFALYNTQENVVLLKSSNYVNNIPPDFSEPLDGFLSYQCNCPLSLYIQNKNLVPYFLAESKNIYLPALILIFLLLIGGIGAFVVYEKVQFQAKSKQDFYNFLTHELKTPVFTMSIASKLLENYNLNEKALEAVHIIKTENNKLKIQIERILEMVVADKSMPQLEKVNIDLSSFFLSLANDFSTQISQDSSIRFTQQIDIFSRSILADKHYLQNVFMNLLENAKKFKTGTVNIQLIVKHVNDEVFIDIIDDGWGMENKFQKLIFKPFFRIKQSANVQGYGLGLSYVKKMIKFHHGKLILQSTLGKGSKFTVILPLIKD
ncbi:MAG: HAMP domain-containing histidine kinase [Haliscomenobacter sp.]|nr:HAMP domain-containing histidine kinase [Haliscomenobacter sp.]